MHARGWLEGQVRRLDAGRHEATVDERVGDRLESLLGGGPAIEVAVRQRREPSCFDGVEGSLVELVEEEPKLAPDCARSRGRQ